MVSCDRTTCIHNEWNIINQTFCAKGETTIKGGKCVDFQKRTTEQQLLKRKIYPYMKNGKNLY